MTTFQAQAEAWLAEHLSSCKNPVRAVELFAAHLDALPPRAAAWRESVDEIVAVMEGSVLTIGRYVTDEAMRSVLMLDLQEAADDLKKLDAVAACAPSGAGGPGFPSCWWCEVCGKTAQVTVRAGDLLCPHKHIVATFDTQSLSPSPAPTRETLAQTIRAHIMKTDGEGMKSWDAIGSDQQGWLDLADEVAALYEPAAPAEGATR